MDVAETNEMKKLSRWFSLKTLGFVAAGVILLPFIYFFVIKYAFHDSQKECTNILCAICCDACDLQSERNDESWITPGSFGDMFGAMTCLFTGLGIIGVIATLIVQHKSLEQMQDDAKEHRKQTERHWFFSLIPPVEKRWNEDWYKSYSGKNVCSCYKAVKVTIAQLFQNPDEETIMKVWDITTTARSALRQYNIIPYNLTVCRLFTEVEREDIIDTSWIIFSLELRFCLLVLYLCGALPEEFKWMKVIINVNRLKNIMLDIYPDGREKGESADAIIEKLIATCSSQVKKPDN